jgi:hypothetical protein
MKMSGITGEKSSPLQLRKSNQNSHAGIKLPIFSTYRNYRELTATIVDELLYKSPVSAEG